MGLGPPLDLGTRSQKDHASHPPRANYYSCPAPAPSRTHACAATAAPTCPTHPPQALISNRSKVQTRRRPCVYIALHSPTVSHVSSLALVPCPSSPSGVSPAPWGLCIHMCARRRPSPPPCSTHGRRRRIMQPFPSHSARGACKTRHDATHAA